MVRTPAQETALTAFIDAAKADEDYGYPHGAAFIAADDPERAAGVLWSYLQEGRPTVLVKEDRAEMLILPVRLSLYRRLADRLRGRLPVEVACRPYPMTAEMAAHHHGSALRAEIKRDSLVSDDLAFACA